MSSSQQDVTLSDSEEENVSAERVVENRFVILDCLTYIKWKKKEMEQIFNFSLTKYGDVSSDSDAKYLFALKKKNDAGRVFKKVIELEAQAFTSRQTLQSKISEFSGLAFVMPVVNSKILSAYLQWAQNEYLESEVRSFQYAELVGFQKPNVWFLSNSIQIEGTRLIPEVERQFFTANKELMKCFLTLTPTLLRKTTLNNFYERFLLYSQSFAKNQVPFLQTISFALLRIIKSGDQITADESRFGCLYSKGRNIGKTTILRMLGHGIGIEDTSNHSFFLSGGDNLFPSTTSKAQHQFFSRTNLLVIVNELKLSGNISSALLQAHEGFASGSLRGFCTAKASMFCSSNFMENERLEGRIHRVNFVKCKYTTENQNMLDDQLKPLTEEHKGFLIAWCCFYKELYLLAEKSCKERLHRIIQKHMADSQRRLTFSIANTIIVYCLVFITADVHLDIIAAFEQIVVSPRQPNEAPFIERLSENLMEALNESDDVLSWINPTTRFSNNRTSHEAIAIRVSKCNMFTDVTAEEIASFLSEYGKHAYMTTAFFAPDGLLELKDINNKTKGKSGRCHKFPWEILPRNLKSFIRIKFSLPEDRLEENFPNEIAGEETTSQLSLDDRIEILDVFEKLQVLFETMFGQNPRGLRNHSPKKRVYDNMSRSNKEAFKLGYDAALGKRKVHGDFKGYESA